MKLTLDEIKFKIAEAEGTWPEEWEVYRGEQIITLFQNLNLLHDRNI